MEARRRRSNRYARGRTAGRIDGPENAAAVPVRGPGDPPTLTRIIQRQNDGEIYVEFDRALADEALVVNTGQFSAYAEDGSPYHINDYYVEDGRICIAYSGTDVGAGVPQSVSYDGSDPLIQALDGAVVAAFTDVLITPEIVSAVFSESDQTITLVFSIAMDEGVTPDWTTEGSAVDHLGQLLDLSGGGGWSDSQSYVIGVAGVLDTGLAPNVFSYTGSSLVAQSGKLLEPVSDVEMFTTSAGSAVFTTPGTLTDLPQALFEGADQFVPAGLEVDFTQSIAWTLISRGGVGQAGGAGGGKGGGASAGCQGSTTFDPLSPYSVVISDTVRSYFGTSAMVADAIGLCDYGRDGAGGGAGGLGVNSLGGAVGNGGSGGNAGTTGGGGGGGRGISSDTGFNGANGALGVGGIGGNDAQGNPGGGHGGNAGVVGVAGTTFGNGGGGGGSGHAGGAKSGPRLAFFFTGRYP